MVPRTSLKQLLVGPARLSKESAACVLCSCSRLPVLVHQPISLFCLFAQVGDINDGPVVLAGYGYGLPISRLYARYFGGDLQIISMEG